MTTNNAKAAIPESTTQLKRSSRVIAICILLLLLGGVGAVLLRLSHVPQQTPIYDGNPIYDEAKAQSEKFWGSMLDKCGDSYYGVVTFAGQDVASTRWIYQLKNPEIVTYYDPKRLLSEAEKLNGVEFIGKTFVMCKANRSYKDGKWSEWADGTPGVFHQALYTDMRKIKGKWEFYINKDSEYRFTKTGCGFIPK